MIRAFPLLAIATLASSLALAGCGGSAASSEGAAKSASRLLAAAVKGDRVAFEAEIDRPAVRDDIRRQVSAMAKVATLDVDGGPSEFALDRMISPAAIRLVHAGTGQALSTAPTPAQIAPLMKSLGGRKACLSEPSQPQRCLLTFARTGRDWRLVGMQASAVRIELAGL